MTTTENLTVTAYDVFPGIRMLYLDAQNCTLAETLEPCGDVLEIELCRQGRAEFALREDYYYLTAGDLAILHRADQSARVDYPGGRYQGVRLQIDLKRAPACLSCILDEVDVQPMLLCEKFCSGGRAYIARSNESLSHIFSELYSVPDAIRSGYQKVKVLELLLFLSGMDTAGALPQRRLPQSQAQLAKDVCAYLNDHMDRRVTLAMLSEAFHVSGTLIKSSFKSVYGESLYAHTRAQKMHAAARLLRETDETILEIAGRFGYDNASKFAAAFRDLYGVTPNEYRQTE